MVVMTKFVIRNEKQIQDFLKTLPRGSLRVGLRALADWFLGNEQRGLRHYEPYKYVKPFRSYSLDPEKAARQRRWIFVNLDKIGKNNRTGATSAAWQMRETNGGYGFTLVNEEVGAKWLWSDKYQTRHHKAVGHRTVSSKIASNIAGAMRHAMAEVKKWIAENKPKG